MTSIATGGPPEGHVAVDLRLFMVVITLAMSGAFLAGVSCVPPQSLIDSVLTATTTTNDGKSISTNQEPRSLDELLTKADLFTSLEHSPSGQHLLVDMEGIDADFLDSEERLADAMVRTVQGAGLTMLSYHCHKLMPAGISCVGVLLESHISFHTWPEEGVITLDLFTCGANPLLPVVPVIERLFGISDNKVINTKWSHELRGFRSEAEKAKNYLDNFSDLSLWILSPLEIKAKKMIYSNLTKYQRVDIWEVADPEDKPTYEDGILHNLTDGDPRWMDTAYFTPDRVLFLDGTVQSVYSAESDYHEALVHPAMFAHPGPAHVGIIGGGEGATLRETLKHKTVTHVTMVEIDEELIQIAREYLPKMSDCSDIVGRADNCFDDDIVEVVNENGLQWFLDRFGPDAQTPPPETLFDVIVVDALDPEDDVPFNTDLYVDEIFLSSIMKSLSDDGVIMIQIGVAPELSDPKADVGMYHIREQLFSLFENHPDVASMHVYEEPRSGFLEPHSFMVVCKSVNCRKRWYARSDVVDYDIYDRIIPTKSGKAGLKAYDGTTQNTYQYPPMAWEAVYCRREPTPFECAYRSLDFTKDVYELNLDEDASSFTVELKHGSDGEVVSSVQTKVAIPKGSYIMPDSLARSLVLQEETLDGIQKSADWGDAAFADFTQFIQGNAHSAQIEGAGVRHLEVGGSTLIEEVATAAEANVGRWVPPHPSGKGRPTYSPVYDRHRMSFDVFLVATKDIPAGAELTRVKDVWDASL